MRRMWEMIGTLLITALVVKLLFDMIEPYAIWLVIGLGVVVIGKLVYKRSREW